MNRLSVTFIALLTLTTLASGQLWRQGSELVKNQGDVWDMALIILPALVLIAGLLVLGRMMVCTTSPALPVSVPVEEKND